MSAEDPQPQIRTLTDHQVNTCNDKLTITVMDEPGAGGANHLYSIQGFDGSKNPSVLPIYPGDAHPVGVNIMFQNGPINEVGVNGITQESLLAIVADRLRSFQAGPYACAENHIALLHVEQAMAVLHTRTKDRMARNVEGTHEI